MEISEEVDESDFRWENEEYFKDTWIEDVFNKCDVPKNFNQSQNFVRRHVKLIFLHILHPRSGFKIRSSSKKNIEFQVV